MDIQDSLFGNPKSPGYPPERERPEIYDVTAKKHGGVAESIEANQRVSAFKAKSRREIYDVISTYQDTAAYPNGLTCHEISLVTGKEMHKISGRLKELKDDGWLVKAGIVRDGGHVLHTKS